jgi:IS605 OrfB family transposase
LSRCQAGSRRSQRLTKRKAQLSAKLYRQQRDLLHQAARTVADFCQAEGVSQSAVGDVRDSQTGVRLGKRTNQQISQWPQGQFARYLTEKAARRGMVVEWIDEA